MVFWANDNHLITLLRMSSYSHRAYEWALIFLNHQHWITPWGGTSFPLNPFHFLQGSRRNTSTSINQKMATTDRTSTRMRPHYCTKDGKVYFWHGHRWRPLVNNDGTSFYQQWRERWFINEPGLH
jgi:hypothetical protein